MWYLFCLISQESLSYIQWEVSFLYKNAIVCSAGAHMDDESETVLIVNVISPGRSTDLEVLSSAHGTLVPSRSVWVVVTQCIWAVICPHHVLLGLQHSCTLAQMVHSCHHLCHAAIYNQRRKKIQYFQICRSACAVIE